MLRSSAKFFWRQFENALNRMSYELRWKPKPFLENEEHELRLDFDFVASNLMMKKSDIFFIEIGANDGVANDPIHRYVRDHGWSGIVIEPLPEVFETLKANYRDYPSVTALNFAVGKSDGEQAFFTVRIDSDTFKKAHQFSSFRREIVELQTQYVPDIAGRIEECTVKCVTLRTLLEQHAAGREIDVLQIDAEGYDLEILKMVDFEITKPSIINLETSNLTRAEKTEAVQLLIDRGYRMTMGHSDTTAYRLPA